MSLPPIPDISELGRFDAANALEAYAKEHFGKDLDKRRAPADLLAQVQELAAVSHAGGDPAAVDTALEPNRPTTPEATEAVPFYSTRESLTVQLGDTAIHFRKHVALVPTALAARLAGHQLALFSHIFDGREYAWVSNKAVPKEGPVAAAALAANDPSKFVFYTALPSLTVNMGPGERIRFEGGTLILDDPDLADRLRRHTLFMQGRIQEGL